MFILIVGRREPKKKKISLRSHKQKEVELGFKLLQSDFRVQAVKYCMYYIDYFIELLYNGAFKNEHYPFVNVAQFFSRYIETFLCGFVFPGACLLDLGPVTVLF